MKKSLLGLAISTLFMVGTAHADTNPKDVSAVLSVNGVVNHVSSCAVHLGSNIISLSSDIDKLTPQGDAGSDNMQIAEISLAGDDECSTLASLGKIAYKFLGTADTAAGTSLANTDLGASAASGVGIALYQVNNGNGVLRINQDTMLAAPSTAVSQLGLGLVKLDGQEVKAGAVLGALTIQIERL